MRINSFLGSGRVDLRKAGIATARLDVLVLVEDVTGIDRARLLAEPNMELSASQTAKLEKLLKQRAAHEPLAYLLGRTEFYGRTFVISSAVLEPRPESEGMIELLKALDKGGSLRSTTGHKLKIADIGTGSGALGITAALELPNTQVELLDINAAALKVAKTNVDKFTLNISVVRSDLLADTSQEYDVLLCNLPYVPDEYPINKAAGFEPKIALFGGPDGLDLYRRLFRQVEQAAKQSLYILTESLPFQHTDLQAIARQSGYTLVQTDDFIQVFRTA